ncbi:hypothetical protein SUDANB32_02991 [Streptomyces sp. enrichment culture]
MRETPRHAVHAGAGVGSPANTTGAHGTCVPVRPATGRASWGAALAPGRGRCHRARDARTGLGPDGLLGAEVRLRTPGARETPPHAVCGRPADRLCATAHSRHPGAGGRRYGLGPVSPRTAPVLRRPGSRTRLPG